MDDLLLAEREQELEPDNGVQVKSKSSSEQGASAEAISLKKTALLNRYRSALRRQRLKTERLQKEKELSGTSKGTLRTY